MAPALLLEEASRLTLAVSLTGVALFLPHAQAIELTEVHCDAKGDTVLPVFDPSIWVPTAVDDYPATDGLPAYSFVSLVRR